MLDPSEAIVGKLDELAEIRAAVDVARLDYEAKRAEILRAVQAELEALEAEYAPLLDVAHARAQALEAAIRSEVLAHGGSVKGAQLHAVYARGRITWDTRGLDRLAEIHPDVLEFRREGQPSVSLRPARSGRSAEDDPSSRHEPWE